MQTESAELIWVRLKIHVLKMPYLTKACLYKVYRRGTQKITLILYLGAKHNQYANRKKTWKFS